MKYDKAGKTRYKSIGKKFSGFCIPFAVGLFLTFLLSQGLLQYFASWAEQSLDTQDRFSVYWKEMKDLDLLLYAFSQTPTQELGYEVTQTADRMAACAEILRERIADARSEDLLILTGDLQGAVDRLNENLSTDQMNDSVALAQLRVEMLQDLYDGFYQSLENYLRVCQGEQISVRIKVSLLMFFSGAVMILFFVLQSKKLSRHVLRPVQGLTEQARTMITGEEEIELRYVDYPEDELGVLNNAFYGMVETNRNHMEQLIRQGELEMKLANARADYSEIQAKLERTRLRLLQSRVNPHFMFNILNTIAGLAVEEDADRTTHFTTKTASYFRYSLVSLDKIVKLKEEVKNVQLYLEIQKERFTKRLDWEIDVPESCGDNLIPSMILQPLCENAIVHGMAPLRRTVRICVAARETKEELVLSVTDDGAGISEEILEKLLREVREWRMYDDDSGIGIGNTFQRLQMFYDGKASLEAESRPMECTRITFRLPLEAGRRTKNSQEEHAECG